MKIGKWIIKLRWPWSIEIEKKPLMFCGIEVRAAEYLPEGCAVMINDKGEAVRVG